MSTNKELYELTVKRCWLIFINLDNDFQTRLTALEAMCSALTRLEKIKGADK